MRKTIKTAAEALDGALDKVENVMEDIVEDTGKAAKKVATKAKRQVKVAAEMAEPVAEEVKKAVRTPRKKLVPEIFVQWDADELTITDVVDKAKADYKKEHKDAVLSCKVYVKPQEKMAYYVINDVAGKVEL